MKISVIIPFYNLERYVNECLGSVAAAVEKATCAVEILCVDDGSTDGTGTLLDEFAETAPSKASTFNFTFRIIHQANGGEGAARNAGMALATGDWITFLDGDDVWLANHLTVAEPALARHPDADLVSFRFASFEDGANPPQADARPCETESILDVRKTIPDEAILDVGVYPTFYRRDFLGGAAFSKLPLGADRLFVAQCLARARTIVIGSSVIHGYRLRANSMAHCAWSARKVTSQCDYAFGSLSALTSSGKVLGGKGQAYLASLWLSDVPNRLLRLKADVREDAARHWIATLNDATVVKVLPRFDRVRRMLRTCADLLPRQVPRLAWFFRKCGLT